MKGLTQRQSAIVDFIREYISKHHYSPSYREIMRHFGFSSVGSVYKHIKTLKRKGVLDNEEQCGRSIMLSEEASDKPTSGTVEAPFMGQVTLGGKIETFPVSRNLAVPSTMTVQGQQHYVFQVQGPRLEEERMAPGDLIVVAAVQTVSAGDVVLAILHGSECCLKRYYPEGQYVRLCSPSDDQNAIVVREEEVVVHGLLTGLLRSY